MHPCGDRHIPERRKADNPFVCPASRQTMRNLARSMAFLIRAVADAKEKYGLPQTERGAFTSFTDGK